jgi:hypothetical protein
MNEVSMAEPLAEMVETTLRTELAQGDAVLATARPILGHLLAHDDVAMFNDEVIARVRGMVQHVARQLVFAAADAANLRDRDRFARQWQDLVARPLLADTDFLSHAHGLVLEAQLADRLHRRSGIDAVLSPLLQDLAGSADPAQAALAMAVIATQARHVQHCRRMELPLAELPGALFHRAVLALDALGKDHADAVDQTQVGLRRGYDEADGRLGLIGRLVTGLAEQRPRALSLDHAGPALFVSALALASGQPRDLTVMALGDRHYARLALSLRAAGLLQPDVLKQFQLIHPDVVLPGGFDILQPAGAAQMLAQAGLVGAG